MKNFKSIHIGILRYPGAQEACILGLRDLFIIANQSAKDVIEQRLPNLNVSIIDLEGKINYTDIAFLKSYHPDKEFSVIIIPPDSHGVPAISKDELYIKFLQCHHQKGAILASVSTGAFLLAETGLLAHRNVTTHWKYKDIFKNAFPDIHLKIDQLLINDTDIITSSGGMSWADLGIGLIKRLLGPIVMAETAKMCLIQPSVREQRHYSIFEPYLHHGDYDILKVQYWIASIKIKEKITLKKLSAVSKLTIRTLQRRFIKATGMNITEYLQRFRVHQSQIFLQFTHMSIKQIAVNVGYQNSGAFCKIFEKIVGLKPNIYRNIFSIIE